MEESAPSVRAVSIVRVGAGSERREDRVSVEEPLEIRVGAETLAVTMRTPGEDFDLAAGWLVAEGIVRRPDDIVRMEHCRETRSPEEDGNVVLVRTAEPPGKATEQAVAGALQRRAERHHRRRRIALIPTVLGVRARRRDQHGQRQRGETQDIGSGAIH